MFGTEGCPSYYTAWLDNDSELTCKAAGHGSVVRFGYVTAFQTDAEGEPLLWEQAYLTFSLTSRLLLVVQGEVLDTQHADFGKMLWCCRSGPDPSAFPLARVIWGEPLDLYDCARFESSE